MERELVEWLKQRVGQPTSALLGIGDDAAVVDIDGAACVVATDMLMDGVHFRLSQCGAALAGRKSLAVNLSDLAAMAARPKAAVISLALPNASSLNASSLNASSDLARSLIEGMLQLAEPYQCEIVGGDTNVWDGPLVVNVAVLGESHARGVLRRDQARVGDRVLVTGSFGRSITGKHLTFSPRVDEARQLHDQYKIHACADVSDGLALDASRIAEASGCGVCLDLAQIPLSDAAIEEARTHRDAIGYALGDGEDFELLFTASPDQALAITGGMLGGMITDIGECVQRPGLWQTSASGNVEPLAPSGYLHG